MRKIVSVWVTSSGHQSHSSFIHLKLQQQTIIKSTIYLTPLISTSETTTFLVGLYTQELMADLFGGQSRKMEGVKLRERVPVILIRDKTAKNHGAKWQEKRKGQTI